MTDVTRSTPPTTSLEVRARLVEALRLDLVGPSDGHALAEELLPGWQRPSNWYLTGFLMPKNAPAEQASDADEQDELATEPGDSGSGDETAVERKAAKRAYFPSSMGISALVPRGAGAIGVRVTWGDYEADEVPDAKDETKMVLVWRRRPIAVDLDVPLPPADGPPARHAVNGSRGLEVHVLAREIPTDALAGRIPAGTRSVSVFLANLRRPDLETPDRAFVFQPQVEVHCREGFVARPDLTGMRADGWDDRVADLHYADSPEHASGHGVAAEWDRVDGACQVVRTSWVPSAEVERTETAFVEGVTLDMDALGALLDGEASARAALMPLVTAYRGWIAQLRAHPVGGSEDRRDVALALLDLAESAADRIERGIDRLAADAEALDAFRLANRSVARALRRRFPNAPPRWRAFQLAFLLLNLEGIADPASPEREIVDLLFFPTGGGKTEAYLGLAAFAMVLRRLRHRDDPGALTGAGVTVVMRYTLRLLTLDQLGRAAGLVCALELERREDEARYGTWPFEIGLWVGKAATPNAMGHRGDNKDGTARQKVTHYKQNPRRYPIPIPLDTCPWCQTPFEPESFGLHPNQNEPTELRITCVNFECEFAGDRPLPIVAVDEPLYRRLPAFLIATVDKFASLPWTGPSGLLLGGAERHDAQGFYGPTEPGRGRRLPAPIPPPDLIIQDELHLIAGPLGTMAGLYETAIDTLCTRDVGGVTVRPKVVASTATARRANDQVQALFGRHQTQVFPPPGPDRRDSFFAQVRPAHEVPARLYLGIAAQGRNPKVVMRRVWLALMGAAERAYRDAGGQAEHENPADPYMTVVGYFNSLRELGGARRILEEEVRHTVRDYGARNRIRAGSLFNGRRSFSDVLELTSRVATHEVAEAKRRLALAFDEPQRVDCAIATNMISVGLDIQRLGLMVVMGQPKTHAEYIQATSRVGRDPIKPGLVVTLLNLGKPRDRSHYERFRHYHETFYRNVEVASVTPFAARALDRGFAGALVSLARHARATLTPPTGAAKLAGERPTLDEQLIAAFTRRVRQLPIADEAERDALLHAIQGRVGDLLDAWLAIARARADVGLTLQYQRYEDGGPATLLREILDRTDDEDEDKFRVQRSLRDVEPEVLLYLRDLPKGATQGDPS